MTQTKAGYLEGLTEKMACIACPQQTRCDSPPTLNGLPKHPTCGKQLEIANQILQKIIADPNVVVLTEEERKHILLFGNFNDALAINCPLCKEIRRKLG